MAAQSKDDDLPKYVQIRHALEERIHSGQWPPGTRVPSEHVLQEQFQCSRMTVNKALSALAHAGLVVRKRRLGTVVARQVSQQAVLDIYDIKAEIGERGLAHRQDVVSRRVGMARAEDLLHLGLSDRVRVLDIHICHFGGDLPMVMERRLINLSAVPEAETADFGGVPPGTWLLDKVPWTQAEHRIRAIGADAETAFLLRRAEGSPCLLIERRTWRAGEPITWAEIIHAGDQFELFGRFTPHPG